MVNLGLGGGGGNVIDANIGHSAVNANVSAGGGGNALGANVSVGGGSVGNANVSIGGGGRILGVDASLLNNNVNAQIGVGGNSLANIGIGIGGGGGGIPNDGGGFPNNGGVNPGGGIPNNGGGNGHVSYGGGNSNFGFSPGCSGPALYDAQRLLRATTVTQRAMAQWQRTSNIQLVPVRFCPEIRTQVGQMLSQDPKAQLIQSAARSDYYINAALARSNVRPENILTIQHSGRVLRIFVY